MERGLLRKQTEDVDTSDEDSGKLKCFLVILACILIFGEVFEIWTCHAFEGNMTEAQKEVFKRVVALLAAFFCLVGILFCIAKKIRKVHPYCAGWPEQLPDSSKDHLLSLCDDEMRTSAVQGTGHALFAVMAGKKNEDDTDQSGLSGEGIKDVKDLRAQFQVMASVLPGTSNDTAGDTSAEKGPAAPPPMTVEEIRVAVQRPDVQQFLKSSHNPLLSVLANPESMGMFLDAVDADKSGSITVEEWEGCASLNEAILIRNMHRIQLLKQRPYWAMGDEDSSECTRDFLYYAASNHPVLAIFMRSINGDLTGAQAMGIEVATMTISCFGSFLMGLLKVEGEKDADTMSKAKNFAIYFVLSQMAVVIPSMFLSDSFKLLSLWPTVNHKMFGDVGKFKGEQTRYFRFSLAGMVLPWTLLVLGAKYYTNSSAASGSLGGALIGILISVFLCVLGIFLLPFFCCRCGPCRRDEKVFAGSVTCTYFFIFIMILAYKQDLSNYLTFRAVAYLQWFPQTYVMKFWRLSPIAKWKKMQASAAAKDKEELGDVTSFDIFKQVIVKTYIAYFCFFLAIAVSSWLKYGSLFGVIQNQLEQLQAGGASFQTGPGQGGSFQMGPGQGGSFQMGPAQGGSFQMGPPR